MSRSGVAPPFTVHRSPFTAGIARLAGALVLAAALPALAQQADYAREKRWADEITPAILVGDPVYLKTASGRRFLSIYTPAAKPKAGIVVVHGSGVHPDWALINTLRSELPDHGYSTLSIQMPVLAADAPAEAYAPLFPEAGERLGAAVAYLRKAGIARVAIVSHSLGSRMTDAFLAGAPGGIDAWVAVGLTGPFGQPGALAFPVLDLYGAQDFPGVRNSASDRRDALRALRGSAQVEVQGADHFFDGRGKELVSAVRIFLDRALRASR